MSGMRPFLAAGGALLALGVGYACWTQTATPSVRGFTEADVAKVEQSIRTEFAKRDGLKVQDVKLVRESPARLTGIATVSIPSMGIVEKACNASLGNRGQPIWQCN